MYETLWMLAEIKAGKYSAAKVYFESKSPPQTISVE